MVATTHKVNFAPNPMQKSFIESKAQADLFSSRMGEGKSVALTWSTFYHARHNPGAKWAIIRDTWENLGATTLKTFFEWFPPGIMGHWHATNRTFTFASGVADGEVTFLGMDAPEDASKLMSRELAGFAIDEPAPAATSVGVDELIFDIGLSRLRQANMKWYGVKLAENNPDEAHWTYRRFVAPGTTGFKVWQPNAPENEKNLPSSYYSELRKVWSHRPDLIRRFIEGEFGFQSVGKSVTPQWSDKLHLNVGLIPVPRVPLYILWDFGHNPTAIITQRTPIGYWNILDAFVGDGIGVVELIQDAVKPLLNDKYRGYEYKHIGDPSGKTTDQTTIMQSPVGVIRREIGGTWRDGPIKTQARIVPLQAVLSRTIQGRAVVQVDRHNASTIWHALRGGWHYHVARTGLVSGEPMKDQHSHPGDAMGYGAAVLFPVGKISQGGVIIPNPKEAGYFGKSQFIGRPVANLPAHGAPLPRN